MCNAIKITVCRLWLAVAMETDSWVREILLSDVRGQQLFYSSGSCVQEILSHPMWEGSTGVSFAKLGKYTGESPT